MLTAALTRLRGAAAGEAGFTMMELVVAMALGLVVLTTIVTILRVTLTQAAGTFSAVDSTQRARTTLTGIEQELQSSCMSSGVTPIQGGSTASSLIFLSAYGNAAQPTPIEHDIAFSPAAGTLVDYQYAVTGGSAPDWTFSVTPSSSTTLLTNVAQSGATAPFQYFAYQEAPNGQGGYYADGGGNPYMMLLDGSSSVPNTSPAVIPAASPLTDALPTGLTALGAQGAAEVLITLSVGPSKTKAEAYARSTGRLTVTDSIVLRLTPPPNNTESGGTFAPCQ
jgi:hypothetical protein